MKIEKTRLADALILTPDIFSDERGFFYESWNEAALEEQGFDQRFCQDNYSYSHTGVLRGLHYQVDKPQGKLISVFSGRIWDLIVDLRKSSATFGQHFSVELSDTNHKMLWVPPGFAHGFYVLGEQAAKVHYKCTNRYAPELERTIKWNDTDLAIGWPFANGIAPMISTRDQQGVEFSKADLFD